MVAQLLSTVEFWQAFSVPERALFCGLVTVLGLTLIAFVVFGGILGKLSGRRFIKSCKTIGNFANESGVIDDGNLEQFEATCFNEKTDKTFMEGWEAFKGARFDYPSKYVDSDKIKAKYSGKKFKVGLFRPQSHCLFSHLFSWFTGLFRSRVPKASISRFTAWCLRSRLFLCCHTLS